MKKIIALLGAVSLLLTVGAGCAKKETRGLTLYDRTGQTICVAESAADLKKDDRWAFLEIALTEAVKQLATRWDVSRSDAEERLFAEGYRITTTFDPMAFDALQSAMKTAEEGLSYGCALTNLQGDLLAVYSAGDANHASTAHEPYEAFAPLSVYAPAMDQDLIHWSTIYPDASGAPITVSKGVADASQTVAEQCLQTVGDNSKFLSQLGLDRKMEGMTPVQLAGGYQIFATGGQYTEPTTVKLITDETGTVVYVRQQETHQVITQETADVLNRMLQGAVQPDGAAPKAKRTESETAGSAGRGETGSWFVGVTPGYSCAVWHSTSEGYLADALFGAVVGQLYGDGSTQSRSFITHKNLHQIAYCTVSGLSFSAGCSQIELGYYKQPDALPTCGACVK